jgi:hypothetical protein
LLAHPDAFDHVMAHAFATVNDGLEIVTVREKNPAAITIASLSPGFNTSIIFAD